ncbi:MAG: VWA domain-containing protein [Deltaproteobacteria bacterium]|nr:VWA domain-containing protein [Deltaproteobacteria bacterium]
MTWQHPLVLALLPGALAAAWWLFRARGAADSATRFPRIARLWADRHGLHDAPARAQRRVRGAALTVAAVLALLALARPQWGEIAEPRLQRGREVMLALDLSRSMLADDVAPSRLARAKLLVDALLDQLKGERVGLTVFAGTAFVQSPLSADYEVLRELLAGLDPSYLPQGGSNYGAMLDAAGEAFGAQGDGDRYLVVLSDGEAQDESWTQHVAALRERGIRVIGLGIGTPQGALVPAADGGTTRDTHGNAVLSKLEPATLQALATDTGGTYRDAATWVDIAELVGATVAQGQKGDYVEQRHVRLDDRFQWFLAPALLLFLFSYWLEFPLFPLARAHQTRGRRPHRAIAPALAAALAGLAAWCPSQAHAAAADPAPPPRSAVAASQPTDLAATIAALSGQPSLAPTDYARLANETIGFVAQPNAPRDAQRDGVIDDALAAVSRGEQADAQAADWPTLRQQLEALRHPPAQPQSQEQKQQSSPDQQQQGGGQQQHQQQSADSQGSSGAQQDQQQQQGGSSKSQPGGADAQQQDAAAEPRQNDGAQDATQQAKRDSSRADGKPADDRAADQKQNNSGASADEQNEPDRAAQGDAAAQQEQQAAAGSDAHTDDVAKPDHAQTAAAPQAADKPPQPLDAAGLGSEPKDEKTQDAPAPTKLVGGGPAMAADAAAEAEAEAQGDLALADALGRMRQVKQGDAPAVLFDRMNRAEGRPRQPSSQQDW